MLTKEQRQEIALKVHGKATATNKTLTSKYNKDVLATLAYKRADAVISALQRALNNAYCEVTEAQLLDAKRKLEAASNGNREARRVAKVEANRQARKAAADEKKRQRAEARKKAAHARTSAQNEGKVG